MNPLPHSAAGPCPRTQDELWSALGASGWGANQTEFAKYFVPKESQYTSAPPLCNLCKRAVGSHGSPSLYASPVSAPAPTHAPFGATSSGETVVAMESDNVKDSGWTLKEKASVIFAWVTSLWLWFCLLVVIPVCESNKSAGPGMCTTLYGRQKSGGKFEYHFIFWIAFSVIYLIYLYQSMHSPTRRYLSNQLDKKAGLYIKDIWETAPSCWFFIDCFHYETRRRTVDDGKGGSKMETYEECVTTHSARGYFTFDSWRTVGDGVTLPGRKVMRMRTGKKLAFADEHTKQQYQSQFDAFIALNDRDTHKRVDYGMNIEGYRDYVLAFDDPANPPPGYSEIGFIIATIFTLTIPYRYYVLMTTIPVEWEVVKEVKCR